MCAMTTVFTLVIKRKHHLHYCYNYYHHHLFYYLHYSTCTCGKVADPYGIHMQKCKLDGILQQRNAQQPRGVPSGDDAALRSV